MKVICLDTETHPIQPGVQFPPVVCLQFQTWTDLRPMNASILHTRDMTADHLEWVLEHDLIVGAITAYDVGVLINRYPHLIRKWFEAYRDNRVTDIVTRQKLIDLAAGRYRGYATGWVANGRPKWVSFRYNLDDVQFRYSAVRLDKSSQWRLRFGELEPYSVHDWPQEAVDYALLDVRATGWSFVGQERGDSEEARIAAQNFPGRDPLVDQFNQARAAFWLKLMSAHGLRTDKRAVYEFKAEVEQDYAALAEVMVDKKLVRKEYERPRANVIQYAQQKGLAHALYDKHGAITLGSKQLKATGDPILNLCAEWDNIKGGLALGHAPSVHAFQQLQAAGVASFDYKKSQKKLAELTQWAFESTGRPVPVTDKGNIQTDKEVLERSEHPDLISFAELASLAKTISTDIPILISGADYPIHSHFEELEATGRTGSSAPNVQNVRRKKGIRECFVPRPGNVFADADYSMLELHTHAQICLWLFGYSRLAEILNAGQDPHSQVAAVILGMSYEDVVAAKEAGDPHVSNVRDCAKVNNFGRRGGLGDETLIAYASKAYDVKITPKMAADLKVAGEVTFPEMKDYADYINQLETYPDSGLYNVVQPWSNRLRAETTFCSGMNSLFQGLGADVAKLAGWYLTWACYVETESPLYGARPVNFPHDQFLVEVPEATAHEAALELERLMNAAGKHVLPDVPVKAKPLLARRWSKLAKRTTDQSGRLVPWG